MRARSLLRVVSLLVVAGFATGRLAFASADPPAASPLPSSGVETDAAQLKVIDHRFEGQGRCSQICPIMVDICKSDGGKPGRCWCDEKPDGVTIGHIICS